MSLVTFRDSIQNVLTRWDRKLAHFNREVQKRRIYILSDMTQRRAHEPHSSSTFGRSKASQQFVFNPSEASQMRVRVHLFTWPQTEPWILNPESWLCLGHLDSLRPDEVKSDVFSRPNSIQRISNLTVMHTGAAGLLLSWLLVPELWWVTSVFLKSSTEINNRFNLEQQ